MSGKICFSLNERQYNGFVQLMKEASVDYPTHEYKDVVEALMSNTVFDTDMCDIVLSIDDFQPVFWYLLNTCLAVFKTTPDKNWFVMLKQQQDVISKKAFDEHLGWVHSECVKLLKQDQSLTRQMLIERLGISPYVNRRVHESEISLRIWRNEARNDLK